MQDITSTGSYIAIYHGTVMYEQNIYIQYWTYVWVYQTIFLHISERIIIYVLLTYLDFLYNIFKQGDK